MMPQQPVYLIAVTAVSTLQCGSRAEGRLAAPTTLALVAILHLSLQDTLGILPMMRYGLLAVLLCWLLPIYRGMAQDEKPERLMSLADFEADAEGWNYVGGQEFPGAKGELVRDTTVGHNSHGSLRLTADFTEGGAYVGLWKELPDLEGRHLTEIRLWIKTTEVLALGVRLLDHSGQCHQKKNVPLVADGEWHELILHTTNLIGEEHWGGANDGKWHGPAKAFGLNIGRGTLLEGAQGTVWFDDVVLTVSTAQLGRPTVLTCTLAPPSCRPGFGTNITYRWEAEPMGRDFEVFVHFRASDGSLAFQNDHVPPVATSVWEGHLEYEHTIVVPTTMAEGEYRIMVGLYDRAAAERGWDHPQLNPGPGVQLSADGTTCQIGTLVIDAEAPLPSLGPPTLNLDGYHLSFAEEFDEPLEVSAWGPGTRWIAHTPYAGDFGEARFADPEERFPFTINDGLLRIEARKDKNGWRAGLLCSVDPHGEGFSQQYGYFEMRAKFPKGKGVWPAFWLLGLPRLKDKSVTNIEIDVVEYYGVHPNALHTTVHLWYADGRHWADGRPSIVQGITDEFHNYGVMVTAEEIIFYYDGIELRRLPTPAEAKGPLYLLVNLALGGGWPIDKTPNPSFMYVDYVRVYAKQ
ncbi:MAG: glycoside hydrolase family 16 protein [Candidatus Zipacnadales bacterium]